MEQLKTINSKIFNTWKAFFILLIFSSGGTFLSLFSVVELGFPKFIGWLGFIIFFICPMLLAKQWKKLFTKSAVIKFYYDYFSIEVFDKETGLLKKQYEYSCKEIKFFQTVESVRDDSSVLKLLLKRGKKISYTFLSQEDNSEVNVVKNIFTLIKNYNLTQKGNDQIIYSPNLFATKQGLFYISILTLLIITAVIIQIIYRPKIIPFTFIVGLVLYLQILSQRKRDIDQYNKMK